MRICCCSFFFVIWSGFICFFFFFQAEDGIRDATVTGVQTCALPISFGTLTGKYVGGARPPGARVTRFERFQRYSGAEAERATRDYVDLFRRLGLDPAQAALAFVHDRFFTTSTIVGATS